MRYPVVMLALALLVGCSDSDGSGGGIDVPDDATFCSVFSGEYRQALDDAVPVTDDAFSERIGAIVAWAEVLVRLAPEELAGEAADNLKYHQAQAAVRSAADFIPGSNAMHAWANVNC